MIEKSLDINNAMDTIFFNALMVDQQKLSLEVPKRKGFEIGKNNYHLLTEKERKTSRTFRLSSDLISITSDVRTIYVLINRLPSKNYLERHEISELDYIKFHYEVFMHKVHTICEIMKMIANEVLNIELRPKDCNWNNLIKNKAFNNSGCKKVIQKYYDDFKHLIEGRNLNSHRGIYDDKEMDDINLTYNTYRWHKKYDIELTDEYKRAFPYLYVQFQVRNFKKEKLKEIKNFEQLILEHLNEFFKSLIWTN